MISHMAHSKPVTVMWPLGDEGNLAEGWGWLLADRALPEPTSGLQPSGSRVPGIQALPQVYIRKALSAQLTVSAKQEQVPSPSSLAGNPTPNISLVM